MVFWKILTKIIQLLCLLKAIFRSFFNVLFYRLMKNIAKNNHVKSVSFCGAALLVVQGCMQAMGWTCMIIDLLPPYQSSFQSSVFVFNCD